MAYYYYVGMGNDNIFKINTAFGNFSGNFGKTIKVGNGDLQTAAEAVASIFTGIAQAAADSMNSKDSKNNKDGQK